MTVFNFLLPFITEIGRAYYSSSTHFCLFRYGSDYYGIFLIIASPALVVFLSFCFGFMDSFVRMIRRRIECIQLHLAVT